VGGGNSLCTFMCKYVHTYNPTRIRTHADTYKHTHTHTHTCMHTYRYVPDSRTLTLSIMLLCSLVPILYVWHYLPHLEARVNVLKAGTLTACSWGYVTALIAVDADVGVYIHTYIHTYTHTYIHTHTH
jgi:hypothetical protein